MRVRIEDVRRAYPESKRLEELGGELPALLIFRPLSFWLTPPFVALGITPGQVTWLSAAVALALPFVAASDFPQAALGVAALGFVHQLLDCVDGNVARVTGRTSATGHFLELVIGQLYWILLLLALGILVERSGGGVFGARAVEASLGVSLLVLLNRLSRTFVTLHYPGADDDAEATMPAGLGGWLVVALAGLENLYVFAIALGGGLGGLDLVLAGIAVYAIGVFLYVEASLLRELWRR